MCSYSVRQYQFIKCTFLFRHRHRHRNRLLSIIFDCFFNWALSGLIYVGKTIHTSQPLIVVISAGWNEVTLILYSHLVKLNYVSAAICKFSRMTHNHRIFVKTKHGFSKRNKRRRKKKRQETNYHFECLWIFDSGFLDKERKQNKKEKFDDPSTREKFIEDSNFKIRKWKVKIGEAKMNMNAKHWNHLRHLFHLRRSVSISWMMLLIVECLQELHTWYIYLPDRYSYEQ